MACIHGLFKNKEGEVLEGRNSFLKGAKWNSVSPGREAQVRPLLSAQPHLATSLRASVPLSCSSRQLRVFVKGRVGCVPALRVELSQEAAEAEQEAWSCLL